MSRRILSLSLSLTAFRGKRSIDGWLGPRLINISYFILVLRIEYEYKNQAHKKRNAFSCICLCAYNMQTFAIYLCFDVVFSLTHSLAHNIYRHTRAHVSIPGSISIWWCLHTSVYIRIFSNRYYLYLSLLQYIGRVKRLQQYIYSIHNRLILIFRVHAECAEFTCELF